MNEHGITTTNLLRTLPEVLRNDEKMQAIAFSIAETLALRPEEIDRVRIYPNIDNQPEGILDILAYDFKVDWYNYNYPLSVKRDLIKNNIKVRRKMGTTFATETALRSLHPYTDIEEWFEYGGDFPYFRIILDVTESRVTAVFADIIKSVNMCKARRSKLESGENGIIYRLRGAFQILIQSHIGYQKFHTGMTGQRMAGTFPVRSTIGAVESKVIAMESSGNSAEFHSVAAGTFPVRSTIGAAESESISMESNIYNAPFEAKLCGTSFYKL